MTALQEVVISTEERSLVRAGNVISTEGRNLTRAGIGFLVTALLEMAALQEVVISTEGRNLIRAGAIPATPRSDPSIQDSSTQPTGSSFPGATS